jgi:hypothetical protein
MFLKLVGLTSFMCTLAIFSVDITNSTDPLFYIVSGGIFHELLRFGLTAVLMFAAFGALPKNRGLRTALGVFGWPLIILGSAGFLTNSFDYAWYNVLQPLDFLLVIELGIVMNVLALEPAANKHFVLFPYHRHLLISAFSMRLHQLKSAS